MKRWGTHLAGKESAIEFRKRCTVKLVQHEPLILNMAGVKEISPGFAYECFGKLYKIAKNSDATIRFTHAAPELKLILLQGIKAHS